MSWKGIKQLLELAETFTPLEQMIAVKPGDLPPLVSHPLRVRNICNRLEYVLAFCRNRRVLHVGCADAEFLEEKLARGDLLHQKLLEVGSFVAGIDSSAEAIDIMSQRGIPHVYPLPVEEVDSLTLDNFDVVLLGEVLEHMPNPGTALAVLQRFNADFLITVPNAFSWENLGFLLQGWEFVHDDHCFYFSEHTLSRLLNKCGLQITDLRYYSYQGPASPVFQILARHPFLCEGLLCVASR